MVTVLGTVMAFLTPSLFFSEARLVAILPCMKGQREQWQMVNECSQECTTQSTQFEIQGPGRDARAQQKQPNINNTTSHLRALAELQGLGATSNQLVLDVAKKLDARHAQRVIRHADGSLLARGASNHIAARGLERRLGLHGSLDGDWGTVGFT
jgi:hypothetical protein